MPRSAIFKKFAIDIVSKNNLTTHHLLSYFLIFPTILKTYQISLLLLPSSLFLDTLIWNLISMIFLPFFKPQISLELLLLIHFLILIFYRFNERLLIEKILCHVKYVCLQINFSKLDQWFNYLPYKFTII